MSGSVYSSTKSVIFPNFLVSNLLLALHFKYSTVIKIYFDLFIDFIELKIIFMFIMEMLFVNACLYDFPHHEFTYYSENLTVVMTINNYIYINNEDIF